MAFLVTTKGLHTLGVSLPARKGAARGVMAEYCRSGKVSERDKKECERVLADKGETAESLQPAVVEAAKVAVAKLK